MLTYKNSRPVVSLLLARTALQQLSTITAYPLIRLVNLLIDFDRFCLLVWV